MTNKHPLGVVIGRFQPFHKGHAWLLRSAIKKFGAIVILVGTPTSDSDKNPYSLSERMKMIYAFLDSEAISDKVVSVEAIPDVPDDNEWLSLALKKIPSDKFVVFGDNEWVNGIFRKANYVVERPGYYKRQLYEGEVIRRLRNRHEEWRDRLPTSVESIIKS